MIVEVPAATPVITPVDELTVATDVLELVHVPPLTVELKVEVAPTQIDWLPLKVACVGGAVTVIDLVADTLEQLPLPGAV